MKTKITSVMTGVLLGITGIVHAQTWSYAMKDGTGNYSNCQVTDMDYTGSTSYGVGKFSGPNVVFGATTLSNTSGATASSDAFLCSFNSTGNVNWAIRAGGSNDQSFLKVLSWGNAVFIYGTYTGNVTFYSTNATTTSLNGGTSFLVKYSNSGVVQWAVPFTGTVNDFDCMGGMLYTIGAASVTVYPNLPKLAVKNYDLVTGAAGSINLVSSDVGSIGKGIGVDAANNIYFLAEVAGSLQMPGSPSFLPGYQDIVMLKYDSNGNYVWSRQIDKIGGSASYATDLDCSGSGVYICGSYAFGSAYMNYPSTTDYELTNSGGRDAFIAKYDGSGVIQWAKKIGGTGDDIPVEMDVNSEYPILVINNKPANSVSLSGVCSTEIYASATGVSDNKWYVVAYNSVGDIYWSGAPEVVAQNTLPVGIGGTTSNATVVGPLTSQMNFGGTSIVGGAMYIAKVQKVNCRIGTSTGVEETYNDLQEVYPNPTSGLVNISLNNDDKNVQLIITDNLGKQVIKTNNLETSNGEVNMETLPAGIYFYTILKNNTSFKGKIVKQ